MTATAERTISETNERPEGRFFLPERDEVDALRDAFLTGDDPRAALARIIEILPVQIARKTVVHLKTAVFLGRRGVGHPDVWEGSSQEDRLGLLDEALTTLDS